MAAQDKITGAEIEEWRTHPVTALFLDRVLETARKAASNKDANIVANPVVAAYYLGHEEAYLATVDGAKEMVKEFMDAMKENN